MNYKENTHYVNKHGKQLKEYMITTFGLEEYKVWCKLNAFKYQARAGKKEGNTADKDLGKRDDYLNELAHPLFPVEEMVRNLEFMAKEWENWTGK